MEKGSINSCLPFEHVLHDIYGEEEDHYAVLYFAVQGLK